MVFFKKMNDFGGGKNENKQKKEEKGLRHFGLIEISDWKENFLSQIGVFLFYLSPLICVHLFISILPPFFLPQLLRDLSSRTLIFVYF